MPLLGVDESGIVGWGLRARAIKSGSHYIFNHMALHLISFDHILLYRYGKTSIDISYEKHVHVCCHICGALMEKCSAQHFEADGAPECRDVATNGSLSEPSEPIFVFA